MSLRLVDASPALFAALGAALAVVAWLEVRRDATPGRRATRIALRSLLLAAVALAAARPIESTDAAAPRHVVLAVDAASLKTEEGRRLARAIADDAVAHAARSGFALHELEFSDSVSRRAADLPFEAPSPSAAPRDRSRLTLPLAAARLEIPAGDSGAIVLLSDGNADAGGASEAVAELAKDGIPLRAVLVPPPPAPSAAPPAVTALDVPDEVRGPFAVHAAVSGEGPLEATLLVDGIPQATKPAGSDSGAERTVAFDGIVLPAGLHEVSVHVERAAHGAATDLKPPTPPGTPASAGLRRSLVRVTEAPRVLVVSDEGESSWLGRALTVEGLLVTRVSGAEAGAALAAKPFDAVALDSDAAALLTRATAEVLARRVREGLGLFVAAGRSVASWEDLADSPLRSVLPLVPLRVPSAPPKPPKPPKPKKPPANPPPPAKPPDNPKPLKGPGLSAEKRPEEALPISLLLVIDRSGSMEGGKMELAILAAEAAAGTLSRFDRVGVASFAEAATLDVPFRAAGVPGIFAGLKMSMRADGKATDIYAALEGAERYMTAETNPIRHVILLTDGRHNVAYSFPPPDPVYRMADRGITLTTIGVGDDIDEFLLKRLARFGNGRFFFAAGPMDIPRVFTMDTSVVVDQRSKDAKVKARLEDPSKREKPAPEPPPAAEPPPPPVESSEPPEPSEPPEKPEATAPPAASARLLRIRPHEALAGFTDENLPTLGAPRLSSPVPGASTLLAREDAKPVLAARRPGLGRALLWAIPADDPLVAKWPDLVRLLAQAVRSVAAPVEAAYPWVARVVAGPEGDVLRLSLPTAPGGDSTLPGIRVTREASDGEKAAVLQGVEDGEARYLLPPAPIGTSTARVRLTPAPGAAGEATPSAFPPVTYIPSGGRRDEPAPDPKALADSLGLTLSTPDASIWEVLARRVPVEIPLAAWFIALAVALLPFDVWAHRRAGPSTRQSAQPMIPSQPASHTTSHR